MRRRGKKRSKGEEGSNNNKKKNKNNKKSRKNKEQNKKTKNKNKKASTNKRENKENKNKNKYTSVLLCISAFSHLHYCLAFVFCIYASFSFLIIVKSSTICLGSLRFPSYLTTRFLLSPAPSSFLVLSSPLTAGWS